MAKDVDINIRVKGGDEAEKQGEKFVGLTRKIKELKIAIQQAEDAGDELSLKKLRKELNDTNDQLDKTNFKNKEFADKLGSLPGPLGKAGGAISGLKQQFETFGFGLTALVATVGLIVGAFALLKGAVGASEEQQAKWNKIIIFGERILNGLFAALEPVLNVLFDLIAPLTENAAVTQVLTKAFAGLAAVMVFSIKLTVNLIGAFGDLYEAIKTIATGFSLIGQSVAAFFSGDFSKSADLASQALDSFSNAGSTLLSNIKARGADIINSTVNTFNEAEVKVAEGMKKQTKTEKELADKRKKNNEDAAKAAEDARKRKEEAIKGELAAAEALLEKEKQIALEAAKTAEEKLAIEKKFQDDKFKLQLEAIDKQMALYAKDSAEYQALQTQKTNIEAQQIAASTKYKEDVAKLEEDKKKEKEEKDKEDADKLKEAALAGLEDKAALLDAEVELTKSRRALTFQEELDAFDKSKAIQREKLVTEGATNAQLIAFDKQTAAARIAIEKAQQATKLAVVSDALGAIADAVGRESVAGKAFAVAQAVINTYVGANKALATYPPPFGAIAAGTVILSGLLNVKKIVSTKLPAPPGGKGAPSDTSGAAASSASGGGGGATGAPPSAQNVAANLIPVIGSSAASAGSAIANTLNSTFAQNVNRPVQAFVVSGDVSSAQQLERRRNTAAQLGG